MTITVNICFVDVDKGVNITRWTGDNCRDGRIMSVELLLMEREIVLFVCVYKHNDARRRGSL